MEPGRCGKGRVEQLLRFGCRGFAMGWDYVINWLVVLPFEITAAGITIEFWRDDINIAVWIVVFLFLLTVVQVFGVRGYGEGAFSFNLLPFQNSKAWSGLIEIFQSNLYSGLLRSPPSSGSSF